MTGRPTFVLVHSPLVGPATWAPVGEALRAGGHGAIVPRLTAPLHAPRPWWRTAAAEVVVAVTGRQGAAAVPAEAAPDGGVPQGAGPLVLAGHSGAGLVLPVVAEALARAGRPVAATCFVDALLPADGVRPADGAPPEFTALIEELAVDGLLPPWSEWFGPDAMAAAVPDDAAREAIVAELVAVPATYFEDPVPVPSGWTGDRGAYLSFTYERELAEARARGWPAAELAGGHLHTVVDPAPVAAAVVGLAGAAMAGGRRLPGAG